MRIIKTEWTEMGGRTVIVADAGGTKTSWYVRRDGESLPFRFVGQGLNVSVEPDTDLREKIMDAFDGIKDLDRSGEVELHFFGAGCNSDETERRLGEIFSSLLGNKGLPFRLDIRSDLDGAAVALLGDREGVACILGTGSASGLYDGSRIVDRTPSLGYILGDEGSGASMGKELLNRYFKRGLSQSVRTDLERYADLSLANVIGKVYRSPGSNGYLASFVPFIKENENEEEISGLIDSSLKLFFEKNVLNYKYSLVENIGFVGGVAWIFQDRLRRISRDYGFDARTFLKEPIDSLGEYFTTPL